MTVKVSRLALENTVRFLRLDQLFVTKGGLGQLKQTTDLKGGELEAFSYHKTNN